MGVDRRKTRRRSAAEGDGDGSVDRCPSSPTPHAGPERAPANRTEVVDESAADGRLIRAANSARRAAEFFARPENAHLLDVSEADEITAGPLDSRPDDAPTPSDEE